MKERLIYLISYYCFWLLAFIIEKPVFLCFHNGESSKFSIIDWCRVVSNGITMDLSAAGYFVLPTIILILVSSFFANNRVAGNLIKTVTYVLIVIAALICVADLFLYSSWGFRLDTTPLFYLESPKNAAASGTAGMYIAALCIFAVITAVMIFAFNALHKKFFKFENKSYSSVGITLIFACLTVLFIRGGVGVSTMNQGKVYFSKHTFLNHAAINPQWNFIYSFTKKEKFDEMYRFMPNEKAEAIFAELGYKENDSTITKVIKEDVRKPNILLIILESFGASICEVAGGVPGVTPNLNKLASEGIFFSNFYANSFRTDRGLVAILSAYPGQPTTSLMKYTAKSQNVPTIPMQFKNNGYELSFYYGGDEDFTNMRSYLLNAGFENRVSDKDFDYSQLSTKWGAYDHFVFARAMEDLKKKQECPFFKTILTLNSHEPFDVPMKKLDDPYLNSAAYTDSCLGAFIEEFKQTENWENTLVIMLPDHAARHPYTIGNDETRRYKIPMVWTGGVIKDTQTVSKFASQIDIANTLLSQVGIDASMFSFSKNIFGEKYNEFAFYAFNNGFGFVTPHGYTSYDCGADKAIHQDNPEFTEKGKAFLQKLYDDLAKR